MDDFKYKGPVTRIEGEIRLDGMLQDDDSPWEAWTLQEVFDYFFGVEQGDFGDIGRDHFQITIKRLEPARYGD